MILLKPRLPFLILFAAALALAVPQVSEAMNHRGGMGGMGGKGGFGGGKKGRMGGMRDKGSEEGKMSNPLAPWASREAHEKSGLIETGLRPVYPKDAKCREVASHFASTTRYDGSSRVSFAYHGYHSGMDISSPIGTPLVALADGEIVHKFVGERLVGNQIFIRHTPEDTGLPVYVYSKYKHFDQLPDFETGDRVKMGQFLGPSGDTGTAGGHFPTGYPHLHLSIYTSASPEYKSLEKSILPENPQQVDPIVLYLKNTPAVVDSHAARALADSEKDVVIPYMTTDGKIVPEGSRLIWPFKCEPR